MAPKKREGRGFTLIELIIVIVIIGILASISAPMMARQIQKAKLSEAVAAMGTIRTAERLYYTEYGIYVNVSGLQWAFDDILSNPLKGYVTGKALSGRYFNPISYRVSVTPTGYNIYCNANTALGCQTDANLIMNETGYISSDVPY